MSRRVGIVWRNFWECERSPGHSFNPADREMTCRPKPNVPFPRLNETTSYYQTQIVDIEEKIAESQAKAA